MSVQASPRRPLIGRAKPCAQCLAHGFGGPCQHQRPLVMTEQLRQTSVSLEHARDAALVAQADELTQGSLEQRLRAIRLPDFTDQIAEVCRRARQPPGIAKPRELGHRLLITALGFVSEALPMGHIAQMVQRPGCAHVVGQLFERVPSLFQQRARLQMIAVEADCGGEVAQRGRDLARIAQRPAHGEALREVWRATA